MHDSSKNKKGDGAFFLHWNYQSNISYSQNATLTSEIKRPAQTLSRKLRAYPLLTVKIRKCKQETCRGWKSLATIQRNVRSKSVHLLSNTVNYSTTNNYISNTLCNSQHDGCDSNSVTVQTHTNQGYKSALTRPFIPTYRNNFQLSIDVHHVAVPRHPRPTFDLSRDGRSTFWTVGWSYTKHSHHIHTSVRNVWMYEYQ